MSDIPRVLEDADRILLVTHRHADRDALGAAIGLRALLDGGTVCTPEGVAKPAQSLLRATGTEPVEDPDVDEFDVTVVLDAPSRERIAPVDPSQVILIDHHEPNDLAELAMATYVDTDARATSEIVARIADDAGWELTPDAALPLLVGLLDDTGFLAAASSETVKTGVRLIGALGTRASDLPSLVERPERKGQKTARVLGVLRATGYRAGNLVFAVTYVGGHETAAAHALRDVGADLAVVCSEQSDGLRVTARASDAFTDQVNVGRTLLPALAAEFGGNGGGHDGAGVAHLESGSLEAIEAFLLEWVENELGMEFGVV